MLLNIKLDSVDVEEDVEEEMEDGTQVRQPCSILHLGKTQPQ